MRSVPAVVPDSARAISARAMRYRHLQGGFYEAALKRVPWLLAGVPGLRGRHPADCPHHGTRDHPENLKALREPLEPPPLSPTRGPPSDWGELVQADGFQAAPDELPAINSHGL